MLQQLGKYRIDRELGKGAMGVVYLAFDTQIERQVALKTIRTDVLENQEHEGLMARFKNEAQASGRLLHPNIVVVYDFGEIDQTAFLAMEYVQGVALNHCLRNDTPMELNATIQCVIQLLTALEYAHQHGVVHRDIKPANLLLTEHSQLKLSDFGIARLENSNLTQNGVLIGTPSYMSPEQLRGERADARSDLFAVGVLLYQMLTGKRPFVGAMPVIMYKILNEVPVLPSVVNPALHPVFDTVIMQALAKSAEQRFANAHHFMQTLQAAHQQAVNNYNQPHKDDPEQTVFASLTSSLIKDEPAAHNISINTITPWKTAVLPDVQLLLVRYVGPIAKVLLKDAIAQAQNIAQLTSKLVMHIDSPANQQKFQQEMLLLAQNHHLEFAHAQSISTVSQSTALYAQIEDISDIEQKLTLFIGPIAKVMLKKACKQANTRQEIIALLAAQITDAKDRQGFEQACARK